MERVLTKRLVSAQGAVLRMGFSSILAASQLRGLLEDCEEGYGCGGSPVTSRWNMWQVGKLRTTKGDHALGWMKIVAVVLL